MNGLPSTLYTAAFTLCVFAAGLLGGRTRRTGRALTWFTGFLVLESLAFVCELLMAHPATPLKALWLGLRMDLSLLLAPCLWLAVREVVEEARPRMASLSTREVGTIFAGCFLTLPLYETAHFGVLYYNPHHVVSPLHAHVIHGTMLLCIGIFAVQVPIYLRRCRVLLADRGSASGTPAWVGVALFVLLSTWFLGITRTLQCAFLPTGPGTVLFFAVVEVGVTVAALYLMVRRASLPPHAAGHDRVTSDGTTRAAALAVPRAPSRAPVENAPASAERVVTQVELSEPAWPPLVAGTAQLPPIPSSPAKRKYSKSALDPAMRDRIRRKLDAAMTTEGLFRDSLLNLRSLSRAIRENTHSVSQVLNQDLQASFYEFVNRHRVDEASRLLLEHPEQTVLEIALAVGFNSKSTFNTAFRRITGTTPREFRSANAAPGNP